MFGLVGRYGGKPKLSIPKPNTPSPPPPTKKGTYGGKEAE